MKKIAVFSDVHYGIEMLERMLKEVGDVDYYFFLGDGLQGVLSTLSIEERSKLYYVEGNCDAMYQSDNIVDIEDKKFLLTHGNKYHVKSDMYSITLKGREVGADMVLFGHTHIAYHDNIDGIEYLNPGSLGYMKEYALVIIENGKIFVVPQRLV